MFMEKFSNKKGVLTPDDLTISQTFQFELGTQRKALLEIISKKTVLDGKDLSFILTTLDNNDPKVVHSILKYLNDTPDLSAMDIGQLEEALDKLVNILSSTPEIKVEVLALLRRFTEINEKFVYTLLLSESYWVRRQAIYNIGYLDESKAFPILVEILKKSDDREIITTALLALKDFQRQDVTLMLEEILSRADLNLNIKQRIESIILYIKIVKLDPINACNMILRDYDEFVQSVDTFYAATIINFCLQSFPENLRIQMAEIIENLRQNKGNRDMDTLFRYISSSSFFDKPLISEVNQLPSDLSNYNDIFRVQLENPQLVNIFSITNNLVKSYRKLYGDKFIGVTFMGSAANGYWQSGSDIDLGIICRSREIGTEFMHDLNQSLKCLSEIDQFSSIVNIDYTGNPKFIDHHIFQGIFIGDEIALKTLQAEIIKQSNEGLRDWNDLRLAIIVNLTNTDTIKKIAERKGYTEIDKHRLALIRVLQNLPPIDIEYNS